MERNRARIISLALLWCLTALLLVEGRIFSHSSMKSEIFQKNSKFRSHGRSLSGALDIERCAWMQDSSCQINPRYARVVLSNSTAFSNKAVLEAVFDEAHCLSITHEAACESRKKCEWAEPEAGEMRSGQSHCQYKGSQLLWRNCAVGRLRSFVEDYMFCRKRRGGSCNRDHNCELVKIRNNEEGCGLKANRFLDLIVQSPASQTETISALVESTIALRETDVPDLEDVLATTSGSTTDDDRRRKLLQDDAVGDMLAVGEGSDSGFSSSRSVISGTGTARGEEYEAPSDSEGESNTNATSSSSTEESSSERSTSPESSMSSTNSTSNQTDSSNNTVIAGSDSFIVSTNASSEAQEESGHDAHSTSSVDNIRTQINDPIELAGSIEHLTEINLAVSVSLNHIANALDVIATLVEERPWSEGTRNLFNVATRLLEVMRFRLDSQMDNQQGEDQTWAGADKVWWRLQHSLQDLDILTAEETQVSNKTVQRLVEACEIAKTTWTDRDGSEAFSTVLDVERRLRNSLQNGSSPDSRPESVSQEFDSIGSLEEFVSNAIGFFSPTLASLYPQQLNISFATKYGQTWVEALAKRNKKWEDIKTLVSNQSNMGQQVTTMLKQLHLVEPSRESYQRNIDSSLDLWSLKSLIDEMVGAFSASHAPRYSIVRLPESLTSPGLTVWQRGPQVTADAFKSALTEDASEYTLPSTRNSTIPITGMDAMRRHLASLSVLIDAKITKSRNSAASEADVESIPETTGVLRSVETALNILTEWNKFGALESAQEQNYYGTETTTNFALSLAGCLVLAPDGRGQCRNLDTAQCTRKQVVYGNASAGSNAEVNSLSICAPKGSEQRVAQLLQTPEQVSTRLANPVAVLFFTTAYCPTLSNSACKESEQCSLKKRLEQEDVCRPSSDTANYHVQANSIIAVAAREESCRSYLGFPVCSALMTKEACIDGDTCLWIGASNGKNNASSSVGTCMTNWAQQLLQLNSTALNNSARFHDDVTNCQSQSKEDLCGIYGLEGVDTNGKSQTSLPKSNVSVRPWIVSCLTVVVTVLFLMVVYISCKIHKSRQTPPKQIRSKKGRRTKTKTEAAPPKLPPFPMYTHVFELSPFGSPSQKKNGAFPYDVSALENAETGSQCSRLRVPLQQDSRMERYTSATTAEISEIQPVSEVEEIQPVSESDNEDSEDSWSSSGGWSEDSDEDSENGSGSPHQNASLTGV